MAEKKTDPKVLLKGADELHINQDPKKGIKGGVFFIKDKRAYYADGRPVEPDKLRVCQHCQNSPPFVAEREIDFAKHMVEQHPEHAKGKTPEAKATKKATVKKATKKSTKKKSRK